MAVKGISFAESYWYCSRNDPSFKPEMSIDQAREQGATVFWWGAIPSIIMARIADNVTSSSVTVGEEMTQTFNQRHAHRNREAFRFGIRKPGWENFLDGEEKPIVPEWNTDMVNGQTYEVLSEQTMNQVPLQIIQEVGAFIFNTNSLGEDGRKKLEAQLSHSGGSQSFDAMVAAQLSNVSGGAKGQRSKTGGRKPRTTKKKTSGGRTQRPAKAKAAAPAD